MSKFKRIGALIIAAATTLTFTFGCDIGKAKTEKVDSALENTFSAISENTTFGKLLTDVSEGGSIEIKYDPSALLGGLVSFDLEAAVKLFFNQKNEEIAASADVILDGESVADLTIVGNSDSVAVSSDTILGDKAYGIKLKNLIENLENSVFADSIVDMSEFSDQWAQIMEYSSKYSQMMEDAEKLIDDLKGDVYAAIEKSGKITEGKDTITIGKTDVKTKTITYEYTGEELVEAATEALTVIRDSKKLEKFIEKHNETLCFLMGGYGYDIEIDMIDIKDAIDDMIDEFEYADEGFLESPFTLVIHISSSGKEFVAAEFEIEAYDEGEHIGDLDAEIKIGPSIKDLQEISFEARFRDDYTDEKIEASYIVKENSKDEFRAILEVGMDGESVDILTIEHDKETGEFELSLNLDEIDYSIDPIRINGTHTLSKKNAEFTITSVTIDGRTQQIGELTIILNSSAKMPTIKKFTDILTLDEDELEALVETINENIEDLGNLIGGFN